MFALYRKAFRDTRRTTLWLSIGLGIYAILVISFYPAILEQSEEINELLEAYPEEMLAMMLGETDVTAIDFTHPGTFIQTEFATWMFLILGAIVVVQAFNAVTNAERDGSMDMVLSLPVTRRDYLIARFLNTATTVLIVLTSCFVAFLIARQIWTEFDISVGDLALAMYGAFLPLMVFATFTYLLVAAIPSSRRVAGAIAYLFLIGTYLIYGLSQIVDPLADLKSFMVYDYYKINQLLAEGVNLGDWALLAAVCLVFFGISWWAIDRKELGV